MEQNLTALFSCYARDYHARTRRIPVFDDRLAGSLLSAGERETIEASLTEGASFFLTESKVF